MVGEENLRLNGLCSLYQLIDCHCVRLIAGQEGNVDIPDGFHLGDVLCVAGNVDAQSVEGQDIAVVTTFWMELRATFRVVIGRNGLDLDVRRKDMLYTAVLE